MTTHETVKKNPRRFIGLVVSDKMAKAIVVRVDRTKTHPQYRKKFTVSRRFSVHDPKNAAHTGDTVTFEECRPISKTIRWRLISIDKHIEKPETASE